MNANRSVSGYLATVTLIATLVGPVLLAQDDEKRDRALRILAVGQEPPWREVIEGGRQNG